jgi:hypothetical protein
LLITMRTSFRNEGRSGLAFATVVLSVLTIISSVSGCAGGGGGGGVHNPGTPTGTYTLTISGTSGNVSHTQKLILTVN